MTGAAWEYIAVFAASLAIAFVITPFAVKLAEHRGILDHPDANKAHESPVPYLGGVAMVVALSIAVMIAALARPPRSGSEELVVVLGIAIGLSVIGLVDDLRGLGPLVRVLVEAAAGVGLWAVEAGVELTGSDAGDLVLTIVWVVGITNAFNLLDNMDGLSAGVAAITAGSCFVIAVANGQFLIGGLSAALAGCALGFLRHNFHPARIYMGDAGSLYLGFLLSYLTIKLRFDAPEDITFLVPILLLSVPILDTTLVTVSRLLNGRSPLRGGQDHISHRLVRLGLPVRGAVGAIYVAAVSVGLVALVVSRVDRTSAYVLAGLVLGVGAVIAFALGRVRVYEPSQPPRRRSGKGPGVQSDHAGARVVRRDAPVGGRRRSIRSD
jgi:UDP-GlcNAc:undecaprenyl-phosphate/decaprenyl-phosphate GlcNAc-1-phosphate transferase